MRRFPLYDPPEYATWVSDPRIQAEFAATARRARSAWEPLGAAGLLALYEGLVQARLLDVALKRWVRQGVLSKAWLATGEEAVTVGAVAALEDQDLVLPVVRNEAACLLRGMPAADVLRAYLGSADGPNGGRDVHHGDLARGIVAPASHIGAGVPIAAGVALARASQGAVVLTWAGDGGVRTGEFHEGLGLAAARNLPLVVVVQNNQVALGTVVQRHTRAPFDRLSEAYGVLGEACDGNHVLDVYRAVSAAVRHARGGAGPALVVAETFRMGGHATHDEAEARALLPAEWFQHWGARDPVGQYEEFLSASDLDLARALPAGDPPVGSNREALERIEAGVVARITQAEDEARESRAREVSDSAQRGIWSCPPPE